MGSRNVPASADGGGGMKRLTAWLISWLFRVESLTDLDTRPKCTVCGCDLRPDGHHDYGVWVEQR